tara:strand:- start:56 stop:529 length:474 start_codon:yes stop_codon:yes gene_type:complete
MNSIDKYMEEEWNEHVSNNTGDMISDYMHTKVTRSMLADIEEEEEEEGSIKSTEDWKKVQIYEAQKRKDTPVFSGVLKYFPNALKEVSKCSKAGNDQHHPDKPLHWDMNKSKDEYDALTRHLIDHTIEPMDDDGILHLTKVAWRALAGLERYLTDNH